MIQIAGFSILMLIIILATLSENVISVEILAFGLWLVGIFVYGYRDHPHVREWMEKVF